MKFGQAVTLSVVGLLAGSSQVYAQESSSAAASASASTTSSAANATSTEVSAMIPAGLGATCDKYLKSLDTHAGFKTCVEPLYNITNNFNPMTGLAADNVTSSTIISTLTSLCASSTKCEDSTMRSYLGQFYSACSAELTSTDASYSERIREMYDYLYIVNPFRSAVCTKDSSSQKYCVLEIAAEASAAADAKANEAESGSSNSTTGTNGTVAASAVKLNSFAQTASDLFAPVLLAADNLVVYNPIAGLARRWVPQLSARADAAQASYMTPNATTYRTTSLPYLFLQSNMAASVLCSPCTKSVMAAYIAWETSVPYALGLDSSPILGGQSNLWSGIGNTCGSNFTDAISAQAGVSNTTGATVMGAGQKISAGVSGVALVLVGTVLASLL